MMLPFLSLLLGTWQVNTGEAYRQDAFVREAGAAGRCRKRGCKQTQRNGLHTSRCLVSVVDERAKETV